MRGPGAWAREICGDGGRDLGDGPQCSSWERGRRSYVGDHRGRLRRGRGYRFGDPPDLALKSMNVGALMVGLSVSALPTATVSAGGPQQAVGDLCDALVEAEAVLIDDAPFAPLDIDPADFEPEIIQARSDVLDAAASICAWEQVGVVATDHRFDGIPSGLAAVETKFNLDNQGEEIHDIYIARINDDAVDLPIEEILANPEDYTEGVGYTLAHPGEVASTVADLTTPGSYVAACYIPEGSFPDELQPGLFSIGDGPPHWDLGMYEQFEVT